MNSYNYN